MSQSRIVVKLRMLFLLELAVDRQASSRVKSLVQPRARKFSKHLKLSASRQDHRRKARKHSQVLPLQEVEEDHAKFDGTVAVLNVTINTLVRKGSRETV